MRIFLTSLSILTAIVVGWFLYQVIGHDVGANVGLLVGISIIAVSVYIINAGQE